MNNAALTLTTINIIFLLLIFIVKDPFGFRISSYDQASTFYNTNSQITKIIVEKTKLPDSKFELKKETMNGVFWQREKLFPLTKKNGFTFKISFQREKIYAC